MLVDREHKAVSYEVVQFSQTQGVFSGTALGGSVMLAISVFVAGNEIVRLSGTDAPWAYGIAALLFIPLILSCVQRSSSALSNPSFYGASRATGSATRLFFTSWLILGGYLAIAALLTHEIARRISIALERIFGFEIAIGPLIAITIGIAVAKEILTKRESWRSRTVVFWISTIFFLLLVGWGTVSRFTRESAVPKTEPLQHWLITVSMLAATLWSVDIVMNYRDQFRQPTKTVFYSLFAIFLGMSLLGAATAIVVLHNPGLLLSNWQSTLTWNQSRLEILVLTAGFLICCSALFRVITRITRRLGAMMLDGALPSFASAEVERIAYVYTAFSALMIAAGAILLPTRNLLLISGFVALLSVVLYVQPLLRKQAIRTSRFSLPFHPLIPGLSILICIFLMWILPIENLFIGGMWLLAGALLYAGNSRKRMMPLMEREKVLTMEAATPAKEGYCVLACFNDFPNNESLIRLGSAIASARKGHLLVLRVLETSESLPADRQRSEGEAEWNQFQEQLGRVTGLTNAFPVVRMAPDLISGIKATTKEFAVDFVLVEWPTESGERSRKQQLQTLLQLTSEPLAILKGTFDNNPETVFVGCGNNDHALYALQVGEAIASEHHSTFELLKIYTRSESVADAKEAAKQIVQRSGIQSLSEVIFHEEPELDRGILKNSQEGDLLILGASVDPLSGRPLPDGKSIDVALQRTKPTLIVKGKEESSRFLLRRGLGRLTGWFTALTPKEKSELLGHLKVGLQARADFYLMISLAAAIAITGLIMNDGSIVLGAMLVSPLMVPIVGIACGIALGNLDLIRRSSASTFKGMGAVLIVGIVMTFVLPTVEPTEQILMRTHPGIFDLLAALAAGAAGAYSLAKRNVAGALPGVAMSLSLEPPLATAGYGLSTSQFWIASGAFLLFLTNLAAIVLSGVGVYLLLGLRPLRKQGVNIVGRSVASIVALTLALIIPLGMGTYGAFQKGHLKFQIESRFRDEALREHLELLDVKISEQEDGYLIRPTLLASEEVTPEQIENFRKSMENKVGSKIQIKATILQAKKIQLP